ncbi:GvpL/GvpF family gas vesicle protein [Halobacillus hunanensis]|uniref:GvpL/GvpF family gas vesicle protein n=1 Tax=Halobacillus hunanensis TaxID=578214 RepID=UPI0009A84913|nr:GvpL/GvpF family gas vesicle protein [Halobacillus hunanensis]
MDKKIYLYGLIPAAEADQQPLPSVEGFDGEGKLYTFPIDDITAVVCDLDPNEYAEESIEQKINNDLEWLQKKAFHHHEALTLLYNNYTVIPLKFCTIYNSEESLQQSIKSNGDKVENSFQLLKGNEEWNLKIYCDEDQLKQQVSQNNTTIEEKRKEIKELPPGRQFFERKKIDHLIEKELDKEKDRLCDHIHEQLKTYAVQADVKKNWGKDVTGLKENMSWNSVYLLPVAKVEAFLAKVESEEKGLDGSGLRLEASGPWPAYHFSSFS